MHNTCQGHVGSRALRSLTPSAEPLCLSLDAHLLTSHRVVLTHCPAASAHFPLKMCRDNVLPLPGGQRGLDPAASPGPLSLPAPAEGPTSLAAGLVMGFGAPATWCPERTLHRAVGEPGARHPDLGAEVAGR